MFFYRASCGGGGGIRSGVACQMRFVPAGSIAISNVRRHCAHDADDDANDEDSVEISTHPLALADVRKYTLVETGVYNPSRVYACSAHYIETIRVRVL